MIATPIKSYEYQLLEAYCLAKGKIWNFFYGQKKIKDKGINGIWVYYKINSKDWKAIQKQAGPLEEERNELIEKNFLKNY